ncbi:MAG: hypothetical protein ABIG11_10970, partial [bacterium]
ALAFGFCAAAGILTGKLYPVYLLPLVPAFLTGLMGYLTQRHCLKALAVISVSGLAWLFFNLFPVLSGLDAALSSLNGPSGFLWHFWSSAQSLHFPLFFMGLASFVWMASAVFMPYPGRRLLLAWMAVPYAVLLFIPWKSPEYFFPALTPLAVSFGIMSPPRARKGLAVFLGVLALAYQSGFVPTSGFRAGGRTIPFFGSSAPSVGQWWHSHILKSVKGGTDSGPSSVCVVSAGTDYSGLSPESLNLSAKASGEGGVIFSKREEGNFDMCRFVLYRTGLSGTPASSKAVAAIEERDGWFREFFEPAEFFELPDASRAVLYRARRPAVPPFPDGTGKIAAFKAGCVNSEDAELYLGSWDADKGRYSKAVIYARLASVSGMDVYSFRAEFSDALVVPSGAGRQTAVTMLDSASAKIINGDITEYSLEKLADGSFPGMSGFRFRIEKNVSFSALYHGIELSGSMKVGRSGEPGKAAVKLLSVGANGFNLPSFVLAPFSREAVPFRFSGEGPAFLKFDSLRLKPGMISISSK